MGIDLRARMISDSQKIHNGTLGVGGFNTSLKFTDLASNTLTIQGLYNDTSLSISPETGMYVTGSKIAISFTQSDLTIWDGLTTLQRWIVEFTNGVGQTVKAEIENVAPDRSFGSVLCFCKIISGHK